MLNVWKVCFNLSVPGSVLFTLLHVMYLNFWVNSPACVEDDLLHKYENNAINPFVSRFRPASAPVTRLTSYFWSMDQSIWEKKVFR